MLRKTITALAMTAMAVLLATGTAQAANVTVYTISPHAKAGSATWTENGDTLSVCDNADDGWSTRAYIYVPDRPGSATGNVLIKGDDTTPGRPDRTCIDYSKNISETNHISIKVCLFSGATVDFCYYAAIR